MILGFLFLAFGTVGIFLPVLPTTPFVLLAVGCFSTGNPHLAEMLMKSKYFGSYLENYKFKTGVPMAMKKRALFFLWASLLLSMVIIQSTHLTLFLLVVGVGVTIHLLCLKTKH